jgi:uncharacterized protein YjbI with pentapeptide repeats
MTLLFACSNFNQTAMKQLIIFISIVFSATCACTETNQTGKHMEKQLRSGKDVFIEDKTFTEAIDFTVILQSNPVSDLLRQTRFTSSISFKNCVFEKGVRGFSQNTAGVKSSSFFQGNLSFIGCTFKDTVSFRASTILGKTVFSGSMFQKATNFEECTFFQQASFNRCVFHGEVRSQNANFMQQANFMDAEFDVVASFQGTAFNSTAQFSNTKFAGYADFSLVNWNGDCFFNYAEFLKRSVFNSSYFKQSASFVSVIFDRSEISYSTFLGKPIFSKPAIKSHLRMEENFFLQGKPDLSSSTDRDKISTGEPIKKE